MSRRVSPPDHAAAIRPAGVLWGHILMVFGGWTNAHDVLGDLEMLDLRTSCWTRGSTLGAPPTSRGNPSAVIWQGQGSGDGVEGGDCLVIYGGWDGVKRYSDVDVLSTVDWTWRRVSRPSPAHRDGHDGRGAGEAQGVARMEGADEDMVGPGARTDHTACFWAGGGPEEAGRGRGCMVVFGGSTAQGLHNDVWVLERRDVDGGSGGVGEGWSWRELDCSGDLPVARSSHGAIMAGLSWSQRVMVCCTLPPQLSPLPPPRPSSHHSQTSTPPHFL